MANINIGGSTFNSYYIGSTDNFKVSTRGSLVIGGSSNITIYSTGRLSIGGLAIWSTGAYSTSLSLNSSGHIGTNSIATKVTDVASTDVVIPSYGTAVLRGLGARSYTTMMAPITGCKVDILIPSATEAVSIDLTLPILYSTATATDTQICMGCH